MNRGDPEWEIAERVCTPAELQVVEMEARGMSQRAIAAALFVSRSSVRDRLESAARKIAHEIERQP